MKYKVTFTYKGYIAGVFYNESQNAKEAIESAKLYVINNWTKVRAELCEQ